MSHTPKVVSSPTTRKRTLLEIATRFNLELIDGDPDYVIDSVSSLELAGPRSASYLETERSAESAITSSAGVILVPKSLKAIILQKPKLVSAQPTIDIINIAEYILCPNRVEENRSPAAIIAPDASIGNSVHISKDSVIYSGAKIGNNVYIGEQVIIGSGVIVEDYCVIQAGVKIQNAVIGKNTLLQPNATIGYEGFGYKFDGISWRRVPHWGKVKIGKNCRVGSNSTIDRGTYGDTILGEGVKLDAHVHIAHNVVVGDHVVMAAYTGIAGSVVIGSRCALGGSVKVADHITIAPDVTVYFGSNVTRSLTVAGRYAGHIPAQRYSNWQKLLVALLKPFNKDKAL